MFNRVMFLMGLVLGVQTVAGCGDGAPTCEEVCSQGRARGCRCCSGSCDTDSCESTCVRRNWTPEARAAMFTSSTCRFSLGGRDTFAVCDTPR